MGCLAAVACAWHVALPHPCDWLGCVVLAVSDVQTEGHCTAEDESTGPLGRAARGRGLRHPVADSILESATLARANRGGDGMPGSSPAPSRGRPRERWASTGESRPGLNPDHELVQSGVYGIVRHPIYTSMLLVVTATCLMLAPLYLLPTSLLLYVAGTEIRVRAEEALLAGRFGEAFAQYKSRVPAYVPFLKPAKQPMASS